MNHVSIPIYGTIKLNSFKPLCGTAIGIEAIEKYDLPPFIDASCRREPDFENLFPSISALCRQGQFAPHLRKNDIIVYVTVGGKSLPYKEGHHLVAILQVEEIYLNHEIGGIAYLNANLPLPNNCMVEGNLPYDFDKTAGNFGNKILIEKYLSQPENVKLRREQARVKVWDNNYLEKSKTWQCFVKSRPIYLNIHKPKLITDNNFKSIFNKIPNTRTPKKLTEKEFIEISKFAELDIKLG